MFPLINRNFWIGFISGALCLLALFTGGGLLAYSALQKKLADFSELLPPPPLPVEKAADLGWSVRGLDGRTVRLDSLQNQVVLLNFWATWCPGCMAEMPGLAALHDRLKDSGVAVICAAREDSGPVARYAAGKDMKMPLYLAPDSVPELFRTEALPAAFVIAPGRRLVFSHTGSARWDDSTVVDYLLGLRTPPRPSP